MENNRSLFFVVHFLNLPFEGIDDYVCVPFKWLILRSATDQKAAIAYPRNESPIETRERAKRIENYVNEWGFYSAEIKYETNTYEGAEYWINTTNNLVPENLRIKGAQPTLPVNRELRSSNRNDSSKSKEGKPKLTVKPYVSNNGSSTFQHILPDSISARMQNMINRKPSVTPLHPPIERTMRLENITRSQHVPRINIVRPYNATAVDPRVVLQRINNVASALQNPSSTPQPRPSFIRRLNGQQNLPAAQQHMQLATREQDLPQRPSVSPNVDQSTSATQHQPNRPGFPIHRIRIPAVCHRRGRPNRLIGGLELPYRAQLQLMQQESRHSRG